MKKEDKYKIKPTLVFGKKHGQREQTLFHSTNYSYEQSVVAHTFIMKSSYMKDAFDIRIDNFKKATICMDSKHPNKWHFDYRKWVEIEN